MTSKNALLVVLLALTAAFGCGESAKQSTVDATACAPDHPDLFICTDASGVQQCVDFDIDAENCGACGATCGTGQSCASGNCTCPVDECNGACTTLQADPRNCGACNNACASNQVCSNGACSEGCAGGLMNCSQACVDINADNNNCGTCGTQCSGALTCQAGTCGCASGTACGTQCCAAGLACVNGACTMGGAAGGGSGGNGGSSGGGNGGAGGVTGGSGGTAGENTGNTGNDNTGNTGNDNAGNTGNVPVAGAGNDVDPPEGRTCPVSGGLIADFEEDSVAVLAIEGRLGAFETYSDGTGSFTAEEIVNEGTDECNKGVFHVAGSGFTDYVGAGATFASSGLTTNNGSEEYAPEVYDATSRGYVGLSFRAKAGSGQQTPIRIGVATPWSEGDPYGAGTCDDSVEESQCWNHVGHFLIDDEALGSDWQTYTLCFDRDMYPMYVPNVLTPSQRAEIGSNLLKFQIQFNQGFDPASTDQYPMNSSFDFYIDDVKFVSQGCDRPIFESTGGATQPFGSGVKVGSCDPVPGSEVFNADITSGYIRWRQTFVQGGAVVDTEQGKTVSEGLGYGMLLSAAMGDKETFDAVWNYSKGKREGNGLVGWDNGSGGSATDADTDIAYALYMADKQWPGQGYDSDAAAMVSAAAAADLNGTNVKAGSQFDRFNPSYFSPGFYRKFGGAWEATIGPMYSLLDQCDSSFSGQDGIISDWCSFGGTAEGAGDAGVQSETCPYSTQACSAYDASRIPWRLGYDVCMGGSQGGGVIGRQLSTLSTLTGGRLDLIEAGIGSNGAFLADAVQNEMALLGTVAVAAWATNDADALGRTFRATLDLLERPEYYKKYYSTTLGLLTLTLMTGNWPVP